MLHQGVGWIRPTRLAPEGSPFFAVPGGSLGELSDLMTEVPLNGRLAGLGCQGSRECAPCAAKNLDMNRRESLNGLRGAQMAMRGQPGGWGLGQNEEPFGVDEAAEMRPQDLLFAADPQMRAAAVDFLHRFLALIHDASKKATGFGPPSYAVAHGWWGESYWQQFVDLQQGVLAVIEQGKPLVKWMTQEELDSYVAAQNSFNRAVLRVQNNKDGNAVDTLIATLSPTNFVMTIYDYGVATKAVGQVVVDTAGNVINKVGEIVQKGAETAASVGKWGTFAAVAVAVILGFVYLGPFIPKGRR
jgi:hypothetical protein